jgi:hypothetical protein
MNNQEVEIAFLRDCGLTKEQATRAVYAFDWVDLEQGRRCKF